jgi:hypothetical protein
MSQINNLMLVRKTKERLATGVPRPEPDQTFWAISALS